MKTFLVSVCLCVLSLQSLTAFTGFYYLPGGQRYGASVVDTTLINGAEWAFAEPRTIYTGTNSVGFHMSGPDLLSYWDISIQSANNALLQVGSYTATRFPFQSAGMMGFSWDGCGWSCNTSTSYVDILQIEYSADKTKILKFAVDFIQVEETSYRLTIDPVNDRWVYGSYRYNSDIPLNTKSVPEPSTFALIGLCFSFIGLRRRR